MFQNIKNWLNWPTTGVKNVGEFGNYVKANWWGLLVLIIVVIVLGAIVLYVIRFLIQALRGKD